MSRRKQSEDLYRLIKKEGTHLAPSDDTEGASRGILFDDNTNKLVAHAEWIKVDDSEEEEYDYSYDFQKNQQEEVLLPPEAQKAVQDLVTQIVEIGITGTVYLLKEYAYPFGKHLWQNKIVPIINEKRGIITKNREVKPFLAGEKNSLFHTNEIAPSNKIVPEVSSHRLEDVYEKYMNDMTSEEAQRELLDIFILSALLIAKIRKLSNARIIKNGGTSGEYLEGQKIVEKLVTPEYIGRINLILENNPQLMEEKTAALSGILGRNLILNGQYVPIDIEKFKEAMTL